MNRLTFVCLLALFQLSIGHLSIRTRLWAEAPTVFDADHARNRVSLKTLDGHFPFVVPNNAGDWDARSASLRRRVLVATGLWPLPEKTPLNAVIHGRVERDGFTAERVYFESLPGHFVTGMLFRPTSDSGQPRPGVLCPHGHGGRTQRLSDAEIAKQLASGGEHFAKSGQIPKIARCAQLARMGCVSFIFDMLGYADSIQISYEVAHRHHATRPAELQSSDDQWVFYSPQADLRLQSIMGLQTWNAIRALDFLASLDDVDPERLAVTGGSGGGTQTILLGAIDDRVKVAFPNGMVSTSMQGGCFCENCNFLRIDTGNVELAALFAPKPQAMTAADDWTKDMMQDGYPQLQLLYAMVGDERDVYCRPLLHFPHNYNYVSRATMYQWMNRHLELGLGDPVVEQDFEPLADAEMQVWNDQHPAPTEVGVRHENRVCRWFDAQATQQLGLLESQLMEQSDAESYDSYRSSVGGSWSVIFDQGLEQAVQLENRWNKTLDGVELSGDVLTVSGRSGEIPLITASDPLIDASKVVIWTSASGKSVGFDPAGRPSPLLRTMLAGGATVLLPDLFHQGELAIDGIDSGEQPVIDDKRPYSAFTFGYNRTAVARRSADLLAVVKQASAGDSRSTRLLATDGSAAWAAPVAAIAGAMVERFVVDTDGFRFASAGNYRDLNFVPGAVKYGDLPSLLSLRAPHAMSILGEDTLPPIVRATYSASAAPSDKIRHSGSQNVSALDIDWLLQ